MYRTTETFSPSVSRDPAQEVLRTLLRSFAVYGDHSSTASNGVELLALADSSVQTTPVQDLVRREDFEYLVGFKEKFLLDSEEFKEIVSSENPARVHIDPAQDLVRREDSEYLVGLKEKILLSSEEFKEIVASEGRARVHIDLALKRADLHKRFI